MLFRSPSNAYWYLFFTFQPFLVMEDSIAALAAGLIVMMYVPFAPKSNALVGTVVAFNEKIVRAITNKLFSFVRITQF